MSIIQGGRCYLKAFYGSRISPHMTKTPEGYLVCFSVPICRTGKQEYLPKEIGQSGDALVDVYRTPGEVFRAQAMASFEGKPVTDDHPPVALDATNYGAYTKGVVQNVRRGSGEDSDTLLCDIVIYDSNLVAKVESGKREISCGYDCKYIPDEDGSYYQTGILGNHVAIVDSGRAGHRIAIRDEKPKGEERMKKSILQRMFASFARDAEPDEIREAARVVDEAENEGDTNEAPGKGKEIGDLLDAVDGLNDKIDSLRPVEDPDADDEFPDDEDEGTEAMDDLEEDLEDKEDTEETDDAEGDDDGEDAVTVPPEEIKDDSPAEEKDDEETREAHDRALALRIVRKLKPIVASMPAAQRRRASDALSRELRRALNKRTTQRLSGGYGALARRKVNDSAIESDMRAFGENCRKRNPHFKGGK